MTWDIFESDLLVRSLQRAPRHIVRKYRFWFELLRSSGPQAVLNWRGCRDEKLRGQWEGFRASRLNKRYRVIYRIEKEKGCIYIEKIDAHTYR